MQVFLIKYSFVRIIQIVFSTLTMLYRRFNIVTRNMSVREQGVMCTWCTYTYAHRDGYSTAIFFYNTTMRLVQIVA